MAMIKILFFADTHLGFDQPVTKRSRKLHRGPDFFRNFFSILEAARTQKVDLVIHGGDLFDRSQVHQNIVNRAYDSLFEFADGGHIPLVMVPGNHDRSTLPTGLFLQHPNLHIFYEPDVFHFTVRKQTLAIAGFPYTRNIGTEIQGILSTLNPQLDDGHINLCLMHQAIAGAQVNAGNYTFSAGKKVIAVKDLHGPYQAYLSGHIHPHQILTTKTGQPIIYPGSIERTSWAEKAETKGFTILTIDHRKELEIDFQALPSRPMRLVKIHNGFRDKRSLHQFLEKSIAKVPSNSILKIETSNSTTASWLSAKHWNPAKSSDLIIQFRHPWLREQSSS